MQVWLGHHSPAFTLATYVQLIPEDLPDPTWLDGVTREGGNEEATGAPETTGETNGADEAETPFAPEDRKQPEALAAIS